jgi:hypothetical protein
MTWRRHVFAASLTQLRSTHSLPHSLTHVWMVVPVCLSSLQHQLVTEDLYKLDKMKYSDNPSAYNALLAKVDTRADKTGNTTHAWACERASESLGIGSRW